MRDDKSHWVLGVVYINADDARLLRPLRSKLGWAVNFGNARAATLLFWLWKVWLAAFPPEVFDYRLGNRSALEWVTDQYRISTESPRRPAASPATPTIPTTPSTSSASSAKSSAKSSSASASRP